MHTPDLIPGVYNYCDRWCERCPFTNQCTIFDPDEQEDSEPSIELLELLEDQFSISWQSLETQLSMTDFSNWKSQIPPAKSLAFSDNELAKTLQLRMLSRTYSKKGHQWLKAFRKASKKTKIEDQALSPASVLPHSSKEGSILSLSIAHEVIQWYLFFISAKTERALGGLEEDAILEIFGDQNDANGSAKIALLAMERSLVAWQVLHQNHQLKPTALRKIILPLAQLRVGLKAVFPNAQKFIRPGFDEIGAHSSDY